jgi:hypothetical protein
MTRDEKRHIEKVVALGCCICKRLGYGETPCEAHHPRYGVGLGNRASHMDVLPICPTHHRLGKDAIHVLGRKAWERHFGWTEAELLAQVRRELG